MYVCMYIHINVNTSAYKYMCIHTRTCIYIYIYTCIYTYAYIMRVYTHVYTHIHTYTHTYLRVGLSLRCFKSMASHICTHNISSYTNAAHIGMCAWAHTVCMSTHIHTYTQTYLRVGLSLRCFKSMASHGRNMG